MGRRLIGVVVGVVTVGAIAAHPADSGASQSHQSQVSHVVLTAELIEKFLMTQDALRQIEMSHPPTKVRWAADDVALARALEEDPKARGVFPHVGWTALEYAMTQSTTVMTLMAMDELAAGLAKRLPGDISDANVQFLRNLPDNVSAEFTRWRRINIDPALRELREMPRGQ